MPVSGRSILLSAALLLGSASFSVATAFNCTDDLVPHSDAYNSGDYGAALKEVEPISDERCPEAEHLLGVMYAKGQGVRQDLVQAYALLLLADSDGMEPVGHITLIPSVGDDGDELEIVQFGAQLTTEQINQAEAIATKLAGKRGTLATAATAGPSEVSRSAKELRRRVAGYRLNGKFATIELPNVATPTSLGMSMTAPGHVLAEVILTRSDLQSIPIALNEIEMRLSALARGAPGGEDDLKRADEIAYKDGHRFAWLKAGAGVRIVRYALNGGFAAQIQIVDGPVTARERYWIDRCYLKMKDAQDQVFAQTANVSYCAR
jgi:TPR repeat protein